MTRSEQKEKRRLEILYKGLELFSLNGYDSTKTIDIAKELNISEGLLFHYFKTKEDLYYELIKMGVMGTNKPITLNDLSPIEIINKFINDIFNAIKADINFARMFILMPEAQKKSAPKRVRDLALSVNIIDLYVPIIKKGIDKKEFKNIDPLVLSNAFFRSLYGVLEGYALNPNIDLPDSKCMVDILRL